MKPAIAHREHLEKNSTVASRRPGEAPFKEAPYGSA